ncbi:MAG TPA: excinuclease ABC subunit B [Candidatus Moranbacteria bacterium]|nr:excinuclease ABC subunit B [Candidatus Moranbacteria bacterium]
MLGKLVFLQYVRSDILSRGRFRLRGETLEIMPAGREAVLRVDFFGGEVERICEYDPISGEEKAVLSQAIVYPAKHFVVPPSTMEKAIGQIRAELEERVRHLEKIGKVVEATRLRRRTLQDLSMLSETGFCQGIENYSRYLTGRKEGEPPFTLLDYFPDDYLTVIDESHVSLPQIRAMLAGDRARKKTLIEHGFRLPSALDNRPLGFAEFRAKVGQVIYLSATPGEYEKKKSSRVVEQIIRPTGLVDPELSLRPTRGQVADVLCEAEKTLAAGGRVLITALTKKQAEQLSEYLTEKNIKSRHLHCDVDTLERTEILRALREGEIDVVVGVNLLREGLDLPEVSLVAVLDADKEGFLRSEVSLIQTIGRAARHESGRVLLYADRVTGSLRAAIEETERRREIQLEYNRRHGITPKGVKKSRRKPLITPAEKEPVPEYFRLIATENIPALLREKEKEMKEAARELEFERAALLRDEIKQLRKLL